MSLIAKMMIEKMRAKQGLPPMSDLQTTQLVGETPETKPVSPSSEKIPEAKKERQAKREPSPKIKFRCGHEQPLIDFTNRDCGPCREQAQRKKSTERRVKAPKPPPKDHGRLPHGSIFHQIYDADRTCWMGTLTLMTGQV